jgi:hypothetical protein
MVYQRTACPTPHPWTFDIAANPQTGVKDAKLVSQTALLWQASAEWNAKSPIGVVDIISGGQTALHETQIATVI